MGGQGLSRHCLTCYFQTFWTFLQTQPFSQCACRLENTVALPRTDLEGDTLQQQPLSAGQLLAGAQRSTHDLFSLIISFHLESSYL